MLTPHYLQDVLSMGEGKDVALVEAYLQSILDKLLIPHLNKGKPTNKDFFVHLREYAQQLAADDVNGIEVDLFIGGGVVRTLLAHLAKFVHEQKTPITEKELKEILQDPTLDEKKPEHKMKQTMLTELLIKHKAKYQKDENLLSPFVLGVGSDLDIYYEVRSKTGAPLNMLQKGAGERIAYAIFDYINKLETSSGLRENTSPLKKSLLPIADVKEYHAQINRAKEQGGSLLDLLAFKLNKENGKLRHPEGYPNIIHDFLTGFYEYIPPKMGSASQKQAIRGLRPELEIRSIQVKDPTVLIAELNQILNNLRKGIALDKDAAEQFEKMVRNSNFQLAGNRPYHEKEGSPLTIALEIAREAKVGLSQSKVRHLLPLFLQKNPIETEPKPKAGNLYDKLSLIDTQTFKKNYTKDGFVFHGTSPMAGICVLRGGFILSTNEQGTAAFGPGLYTGSLNKASEYSAGMIIPLKLALEQNLRILNINEIYANREALAKEAIEKGYINKENRNESKQTDAVYELLKDRKQYAIDIIAVSKDIILIENQAAIELEQSFEFILNLVNVKLKANIENLYNVEYRTIVNDVEVLMGMTKVFDALGDEAYDTHSICQCMLDLLTKIEMHSGLYMGDKSNMLRDIMNLLFTNPALMLAEPEISQKILALSSKYHAINENNVRPFIGGVNLDELNESQLEDAISLFKTVLLTLSRYTRTKLFLNIKGMTPDVEEKLQDIDISPKEFKEYENALLDRMEDSQAIKYLTYLKNTMNDDEYQLFFAQNKHCVAKVIQSGNLNYLAMLLPAGYPLDNIVEYSKHTWLGHAVVHNQVEIVKYLLDNGADPNRISGRAKDNVATWSSYRYDSPLSLAMEKGFVEIATLLINNKPPAKVDENILALAGNIKDDDARIKIVELCVKSLCNETSLITSKMLNTLIKLRSEYLGKSNKENAQIKADQILNCITRLIEKIKPTDIDYSTLVETARINDIGSLTRLLNKGVAVENKEANLSALYEAVNRGNYEIADLLIKHGADITFIKLGEDLLDVTLGQCAMIHSRQSDYMQTAQILINNGAKVKDMHLLSAIGLSIPDMLTLLIKNGGKLNDEMYNKINNKNDKETRDIFLALEDVKSYQADRQSPELKKHKNI